MKPKSMLLLQAHWRYGASCRTTLQLLIADQLVRAAAPAALLQNELMQQMAVNRGRLLPVLQNLLADMGKQVGGWVLASPWQSCKLVLPACFGGCVVKFRWEGVGGLDKGSFAVCVGMLMALQAGAPASALFFQKAPSNVRPGQQLEPCICWRSCSSTVRNGPQGCGSPCFALREPIFRNIMLPHCPCCCSARTRRCGTRRRKK